jgi:hypothetical protein
MNRINFREVQVFARNAIALWAGIAGLMTLGLVSLTAGPQLAEPLPLGIMLATGALLTVVLVAGRMETVVNEDGLFVQVFPFTRRHHFSFDEIRTVEARTYRPIAEYGGWGIRYSRKGKAYNVHGNRGVQLTFADRKPLLIGSQLADELAEAIRAGMSG